MTPLSFGLLASILACASAQAQSDVQAYGEARRAYAERQYDVAAARFETLIPRLSDPALRLESRKYYAASLVLLGRPEEAARQFRAILEEEPAYELDPVAFASDVARLWNDVRRDFLEERERRRREEAERERARLEAEARFNAAHAAWVLELRERANTTEEHASRWLALIPFGFGQFQNGHDAFGLALLVAGAVLGTASVGSYLLHRSLADDARRANTPAEREAVRDAELAWRLTNWLSTGLLVLVAGGGILDAQIRFVPVHRRPRPDPLPPEPRREDFGL
ncbi:MAG: hypothetical protein NZ898_11405 [Myxococcota bacterium]|nr:hypothetical protein [Myxococcota bacterium]MDW8362968.1 hypothetical protein [Myxococcales bacterium]